MQAQAQHAQPPSGVQSPLFEVVVELYAGRIDVAITKFEEVSTSSATNDEILTHLAQLQSVVEVREAMAARSSMSLPSLFKANFASDESPDDTSGDALSEFANIRKYNRGEIIVAPLAISYLCCDDSCCQNAGH